MVRPSSGPWTAQEGSESGNTISSAQRRQMCLNLGFPTPRLQDQMSVLETGVASSSPCVYWPILFIDQIGYIKFQRTSSPPMATHGSPRLNPACFTLANHICQSQMTSILVLRKEATYIRRKTKDSNQSVQGISLRQHQHQYDSFIALEVT